MRPIDNAIAAPADARCLLPSSPIVGERAARCDFQSLALDWLDERSAPAERIG
jgi:hypothetical protein